METETVLDGKADVNGTEKRCKLAATRDRECDVEHAEVQLLDTWRERRGGSEKRGATSYNIQQR